MEWNNKQVSVWLIENGFEKYVNKFEGINRLNIIL